MQSLLIGAEYGQAAIKAALMHSDVRVIAPDYKCERQTELQTKVLITRDRLICLFPAFRQY